MCTVLLPTGGYPLAVNKHIISYHISLSYCLATDRFVKYNLLQFLKLSIETELKKFKNNIVGVLKYGPLYKETE